MTSEEFFKNVNKTETCWLWTGWINRSGYGQRSKRLDGKVMAQGMHRYSYELHKGPIPKGLHVLHSCNVKSCVNPDHLRIGTHTDNMRDVGAEKWSKIRKRQWTKFSPEERAEIKKKLWASYSPEQRTEIGRKIAESLTGKKLSAEHREKLALAKLGKPAKISDEARLRKNAAIKTSWAKRKEQHTNV